MYALLRLECVACFLLELRTENKCRTNAGSRLWGFWAVTTVTTLFASVEQSPSRVRIFEAEFAREGNSCASASHQDRVLDIVAQQARVVEGVLGFLHSGVHGTLLNLVLDGPEQFVQGLTRRVLVHKQKHTDTINLLSQKLLRRLSP